MSCKAGKRRLSEADSGENNADVSVEVKVIYCQVPGDHSSGSAVRTTAAPAKGGRKCQFKVNVFSYVRSI